MTKSTLAGERTALSWRRTAIAAMATAALFINQAARSGWRGAAATPVAVAVVLLAVAALSFLRNRSLRRGRWGRGHHVIAATTAVIVAVTLVAAGIGITDPTS
jgi:uncharacterized membrane protein YidH (DUF202 family)